ncbi:glycosyltransferase [Phenylobacterium sp. J426]|uniref:glycosyltransferase n=1 Tax=Phenylobacterium sp. J426 TaxID=2898439 RepID=UPI002151B38A|nr:glycosyltransferase [Phenylobacterium sp. J426]
MIRVVRNWVDTDAIKPVPTSLAYRRELGISERSFVVLYSGNIGAKQGVQLLVEAARRLAPQPDIVFVIAGQGPMRGAVEQAARELPNIKLLDFQPEARFGDFLGLADLHVLPQERSAADLLLPSKLGGMLASGRRILVTADAGTELAEFLGDSCHRTPPGDADALARAILATSSEPPRASQQDERLRLAGELSRHRLIQAFTDAALFVTPEQREAPEALAAA